MILNDNIKLIREKAGIPQTTFAGLFGISVSNLKSYENMNVSPKRPIIARIAKFAGITVEHLLTHQLTFDDIKLYTEDAFADDEKEKDRKNMLIVQKGIEEAFLSKYVDLQNEYIAQLKKFDEAQASFREVLSDVNEQRNSDMKVLNTMIGEVIKRLDRFQQEFDETKKGLYTMIRQVDNEFRGRLDDIEHEFHSYSKETDKEMSEFYERLSIIDPPQKPD